MIRSSPHLTDITTTTTTENEPLKVHLICKLRDFIFAEPPRPALPAVRAARHRVEIVLAENDTPEKLRPPKFQASFPPRQFRFILRSHRSARPGTTAPTPTRSARKRSRRQKTAQGPHAISRTCQLTQSTAHVLQLLFSCIYVHFNFFVMPVFHGKGFMI